MSATECHATTIDLAVQFASLFAGRTDAYGSWEGGCDRTPMSSAARLRQHLYGEHDTDWCGTYPHMGKPSQACTYGCVDVDGKDFNHDWTAMRLICDRLTAVLAVKDVWAYTERSRNGYHVWVFVDGVVPAANMRRCLMAACKAIKYDPKEVNPKSETLAGDKIGNYVRLPYAGALGNKPLVTERYFVDVDDDRIELVDFLDDVQFTDAADIAAVAKLWAPKPKPVVNRLPSADMDAISSKLSGHAYTIWKDGPLDGRDRSNTLVKLAYIMRDDGVDTGTAFAVIKDADSRWGKHFMRPDTVDERCADIVAKAFG